MEFNDLTKELSTNFIEYAVAVNSDRSIPDARSGLKPVARRILYGAYINGRLSSKAHTKSARVVGDVMGAFHPHGDSSIYSALVRLSQPWVMRYPLLDFHGNQGNIGGDGPAAPRYTEVRLAKLSEVGLLSGLKKYNVDFIPNYDETTEEPETLPAIFPNLLCNPNSGIGVAIACSWLPHNLNEVASAINDYLDGKEPMLPGPDFPTGGIIINAKDIPKIMETGHGSVKVRSKYKTEKNKLVFYEIPYGVTIEALLAEIGQVCDEESGFDEVIDIRDESNKKGLRIVIECKKSTNLDSIAQKLFSKTNLQLSISYNQVALVDKTPTEMNLKDCIKVYVNHNLDCIEREARFDLSKALDRLHIVEGLLKALEDIDNIIALIKKSDSSTKAKENLIAKYGFTEIQAKAILDMKLAKLAHLEKVELEEESSALHDKIANLDALVKSKDLQTEELRKRLAEICAKFGDKRRTELTHIEVSSDEKEIATVTPEDVVVIMTQSGDIKRIPKSSFKTQKRNGKGVKGEGDAIAASISTNTIDALLFFTNKGKMYRLLVDNVPVGTNTSKGTNIGTLISLEADEKVIATTSLNRKEHKKYIVFITKKGLIKKTELAEYFQTKRSTGIVAIKLKADDGIANVLFMDEEDLLLITKNGMSIHFETKSIKAIGRNTAGVKSIKLDADDEVLTGLSVNDKDLIAVFSENGLGKKVKIKELPIQGRAGKGLMIYKPTAATGLLCSAIVVDDKDTLLISGAPSSICINASDISLSSRVSQGTMMIKESKIKKVIKL